MATKHRPEHHAELQLESPMDYAQHEATYSAFLTGAKWTVIGLAATLVILYFLIQP
ncbi:MAG: aa3-type cytochrome c oxidase subunit IV [Candidatus Devosia symbiotica]|nr:aa3-type cytochrome c oxidase subunit IV [Candidatus Devosia symbiotica]